MTSRYRLQSSESGTVFSTVFTREQAEAEVDFWAANLERDIDGEPIGHVEIVEVRGLADNRW